MRILAGLELGGATLTRFDDLASATGSIGQAVFGPAELLRDLELRLGVGGLPVPAAVRIAHFAECLTNVSGKSSQERFYTRSFGIDPLGTAERVLELRDILVSAGWKGEPIPDAGPRICALQELELAQNSSLPLGTADRVVRVREALEEARFRVYEALELAEAGALWPSSWQRVFGELQRTGTRVTRTSCGLPGAPPESDLGKIQGALRLGATAEITLQGDGSLIALHAETTWEAAQATSAVIAGLSGESAVVIREGDVLALDQALRARGIPTQGVSSRSPWRSALAILPLALELAFEPKDPYRVLELLTLPVGPFQGFPGHLLACALAESPGIGSPIWETTKQRIAEREHSPDILERIHAWLEECIIPPNTPAQKPALLSVTARIRSWVLSAIARSPDNDVLIAVAERAKELILALENDPRKSFTLVEVRRLVASIVGSGVSIELEAERSGRIDHVDRASALHVPRELVVWWPFTHTRGRVNDRFLRAEVHALARAGIQFPDPKALLAERARGFRRAILAATKRVLLVVPRTAAGKHLLPHPLWDEIVARAKLDDAAQARIRVDAAELRSPSPRNPFFPTLALSALERLPLPGGSPEWRLTGCTLLPVERHSASSLDELFGCPFRWALDYRAGLRSGGHGLPRLHRLNGTLGHRLIERLHERNAFVRDPRELSELARITLNELFQTEGTTLLRSGMAFERAQLEEQLLRAVRELARELKQIGLEILAVESPIDVEFRSTRLNGRIDLWLGSKDGRRAVIDVKWGQRKYKERLNAGRALQLALYAFAMAPTGEHEFPEAAYFSLSRGKLIGLKGALFPHGEPGASLEETWSKVERSLSVFEDALRQGKLPVAGLRRSLPVLESVGVSAAEQARHYGFLEKKRARDKDANREPCEYCQFDALCGKRWEAA